MTKPEEIRYFFVLPLVVFPIASILGSLFVSTVFVAPAAFSVCIAIMAVPYALGRITWEEAVLRRSMFLLAEFGFIASVWVIIEAIKSL